VTGYTDVTRVTYVPNDLLEALNRLESFGPGSCTECEDAYCWLINGRMVNLSKYNDCEITARVLVDDLAHEYRHVTTEEWRDENGVLHVRMSLDGPIIDRSTYSGAHARLRAVVECLIEVNQRGAK